MFCICLPYVYAINRTASRGLILGQGVLLGIMTPLLMTILAKRRNCLIVGADISPRLSHRILLEVAAISGALLVSVAILRVVSGRTWGQLLPIHLWTAMLPVYVGFIFITSLQVLLRAKKIVQPADGYLTKIQAMLRGEVVIVDVNEVEVFASENHETVAYVGDREYICDLSLNRLSERLDSRLFVRSHRSYLLNLGKVAVLTAEGTEVKTVSGRAVLVSKRNRGELRRALRALAT